MARPSAVVTLPTHQRTVILAMDTSGSMRATDVEPSRMAAAQAAAKSFVTDQPRGTRIGVVTFAGTAAVAQAPTDNREEILAAIDRFQLQRPPPSAQESSCRSRRFSLTQSSTCARGIPGANPRRSPLDQAGKPEKPEFKPVPPGSYTSAVIILLTDGQSNVGPDPIESARIAAERGVRVYTVASARRKAR